MVELAETSGIKINAANCWDSVIFEFSKNMQIKSTPNTTKEAIGWLTNETVNGVTRVTYTSPFTAKGLDKSSEGEVLESWVIVVLPWELKKWE